ncbi:lipopolysaccharide biosynthesis protein [Ketobacter sp.]|uniref:lipopolysaccharide biosynthesis protein n=1 Tax=Ketobacter sp. TaxID=2083498 RepID=UPI000F2CE6E3|nr:oligosaccharide flippase family protein [Ketobacter sp.]RLT92287.1 MAG: hypothetical protein D9N14_22520 [Ketobacter sp.]
MTRHSFNSVLKGGVSALLIRCTTAAVGFALNYFVVRILGANDAGVFFSFLSYLYISNAVAQLGLDITVSRGLRFARNSLKSVDVKALHSTCFSIVFLASLLQSVAYIYFVDEICSLFDCSTEDKNGFVFLAIAIVPYSLQWYLSYVFQGSGHNLKFNIFQNLTINSLFIILALAQWSIDPSQKVTNHELGIFFLVATTASLTFSWIIVPVEFKRPSLSVLYKTYKETVSISAPMFASSLISIAATWLPVILLGIWSSTEDAALYAIATRISSIVSLILMAFNSYTFPKYAELFSIGDTQGIKLTSMHSNRLIFSLALPISALLAVYSSNILSFFSEDFTYSNATLCILIFAQTINVVSGSSGGILGMTKHQNSVLSFSFVSFFAMIIVNAALIKSYGAYGAAWAQLVFIALQSMLGAIAVKLYFGFFPSLLWLRK